MCREAHRCCYRCPVPRRPLHGDVVSDEALEFCRACRDEAEYGAPAVPAAFILWGKLFPPEALGPRCFRHAALYIDTFRSGEWAAFDLHGLTRVPDVATPPLVAAPPVPPVVPDSEERWADLNLSDDERAGLLSALDPGRCVCRHLELTCTGPDGHPNRHAAWNGHGNLIAWACYCHSSTSPHMDPEAGIVNV